MIGREMTKYTAGDSNPASLLEGQEASPIAERCAKTAPAPRGHRSFGPRGKGKGVMLETYPDAGQEGAGKEGEGLEPSRG